MTVDNKEDTVELIKEDSQDGFLTPKLLRRLVDVHRLYPVLVRCGMGRFTCPSQDAKHFIEMVDNDDKDYIRDVSLGGLR